MIAQAFPTAVIAAQAGIQGGRGDVGLPPVRAPAVILAPTRRHSRESGNPRAGPQVGGSCFTSTTSLSTGSYAKLSESGNPSRLAQSIASGVDV